MRTYKKVGTDPILLACYRTYQQFCSVFKLDLLFQLQLAAISALGIRELSWQWWLSVGLHLPVCALWVPLGLSAVRRESVALTACLLVVAAVQPPIYVAQLVSLAPTNATATNATAPFFDEPPAATLHPTLVLPAAPSAAAAAAAAAAAPLDAGPPSYCTQRLREEAFPFAALSLQMLYGLALTVRLLTISATVLAARNYGKGLLPRVHRGLHASSPSTLDYATCASSYAHGSYAPAHGAGEALLLGEGPSAASGSSTVGSASGSAADRTTQSSGRSASGA